jgi:hypothetical protein
VNSTFCTVLFILAAILYAIVALCSLIQANPFSAMIGIK